MAKVTVYLPDDLAEWLKTVDDINVSAVTQEALRRQQVLREQAKQVAEDRAAGLVDEERVGQWKKRLGQLSSTPPS